MRSLIVILTLFGTSLAVAQAPTKGMLLVATPELRDPRFSETVVLLLHYGQEGAIGVAINRPTWVEPSSVFPDLDALSRYEGTIFIGGPVGRANVLMLVRDPGFAIPDAQPIVDDVYVTTDAELLDQMTETEDSDRTLRLYAGHASWDSGQLEREIASGSWQLVPGNANLVFSEEPLDLWETVLALRSEMSVGTHRRAPTFAGRH